MLVAASQPLTDRWRQLEAAVCITAGLDDLDRHFDDATLTAAHREHRHGIGLKDLLRLSAIENGHRHDDVRANDPARLLHLAFESAFISSPFPSIRAEGTSTLSLPGLLSNVANKFLMQGFMAVENTWRDIAKRRPVNDFKQTTGYSLTGDMEFRQIGPTGEINHGTLGEAVYTNQADTYARLLSVTRRDIVNDDLGALTEAPRRLGRGVALKLNDVFWTTFLSGVGSFWATGNNNLVSGAGTALSSDALATALTKFRQQTDPDGKPLGITPKILLTPPELEITAAELMTSTLLNTGGSSTLDRVPNRNVWASKFKPVSSTYISNASYTGHSATAWFLLADPMDLPTIEVVFLNGVEAPVIESADADFSTLGIQFRGFWDWGVSLTEPRGSVRAAGQ